MSTFKIIADFVNGVTVEEGIIDFVQQDNKTCQLDITLQKNDIAVDMANKRATFTAETPSGATIEETHLQVVDVATGKVSIVLASDMILEAGKHKAQIQLYPLDSYERESTLIFSYNVSRSLLTDQKLLSSSRFGTLEELILTVEGLEAEVHNHESVIEDLKSRTEAAERNALQSASHSIQSAQASENGAIAVGESAKVVDGMIDIVEATAREAQKAAESAKESADAALKAKNAVIQSAGMADSAVISASGAVAQVQQAVAQVEVAKTSALEAATQANNAKQEAQSAKQIADQAATTVNATIDKANETLTTANTTLNQVNIANNKLDSTMNNANAYKDVAMQSATNATAQAKLAEGSATEARLQAEAASRSLTGAETAKNAAVSAKDEATRQTVLATQKATEAANSATQAVNKLAEVVAEGNKQVARVTTEGNTQVTRVQTEGNKQIVAATTQADRAKTEADRAGATAVTEVQKHVTLDGQVQQNFNFIENEVVQDGLVLLNGLDYVKVTSDIVDMVLSFVVDKYASNNTTMLASFGGGYIGFDHANKVFTCGNFLDGFNGWLSLNTHGDILGKTLDVRIVLNKQTKSLLFHLNGELLRTRTTILNIPDEIVIVPYRWGNDSYHGTFSKQNSTIYNRQLSTQEIAHNFQVLNNSQSISTLATTSPDGTKKEFTLGTDSRHVVMDSGFNQEEAYTELLKLNAEEKTSSTGVVEYTNAIPKQKVISASLYGNTVKNLCKYKEPVTSTAVDNFQIGISTIDIEPNNQYVLMFRLSNVQLVQGATSTMTGGAFVSFNRSDGTQVGINAEPFELKNGVVKVRLLDLQANLTNAYRLNFIKSSGWVNGNIITVSDICLMKKVDADLTASPVPFVLNSSLAQINVNGQPTTFYEPTIQGLTKIVDTNGNECQPGTAGARLVSLEPSVEGLPVFGSVPSVADVLDRASGKGTLNTKEIVLDGTQNLELSPSQSSDAVIGVLVKNVGAKVGGSLVSEKMKYSANVEDMTLYIYPTNDYIIIRINKSKLTTPDVAGFKQYLQANPVTVRYQLATPEEIQLTPEQLKAYGAHKKQILLSKVGDVADKLTLNEDGSGAFENNFKYDVWRGVESWTFNRLVGTTCAQFNITLSNLKQYGKNINTFTTETRGWDYTYNKTDIEYVSLVVTDLAVSILKTKLNGWSDDLTSIEKTTLFKEYLKNNNLQIYYQLATPTTTHIPSSIMPTIPTDKINILSAGDAVKASKFTASLPVDKIGELDARLKALENVTIQNTLK